jgi:hypothetical protein
MASCEGTRPDQTIVTNENEINSKPEKKLTRTLFKSLRTHERYYSFKIAD